MPGKTMRAGGIGLGVLLLAAGGAHADFYVGTPIVVPPEQPHNVSVRLLDSQAGWTGLLWLAGSSAPDGIDTPLFFTNDDTLGLEHHLGLFEPGARLDFIYDVLTGVTDSFRTDDPLDGVQFRWEWTAPGVIRMGIEDAAIGAGDAEYNDMVIRIAMTPIPGPEAAGAVAMLGMFGGVRRRKRRAPY